MPTLPDFDVSTRASRNSHVVVLGAGASIAATPNGDKHRRSLPSMANIAEIVGVSDEIHSAGLKIVRGDFESFFGSLTDSGKNEALKDAIEKKIYDYFSRLRLPDEATVYDKLILGLRPKDTIANFNWDPFLAEAHFRNGKAIGFENLPQILFLHGNVLVGVCIEHEVSGWITEPCPRCEGKLTPVQLLYPVHQKDYNSDPFLSDQWAKLSRAIESTFLLTIFGYSAPKTDVVARDMLFKAWHDNTSKDFAGVEVIDIKGREDLEGTWGEFSFNGKWEVYESLDRSWIGAFPRRSCEARYMAAFQQSPWSENRFPEPADLDAQQRHAAVLIREEALVQDGQKKQLTSTGKK